MEIDHRTKETTTGNENPQFSIIIACFNGEQTIKHAIESVFLQKNKNVELIVIDGASTDNTIGVLKECADKIDYWISEPDTGIYNAWNKGVRVARGKYISFVGADDILLPGALDAYARLTEAFPEAEYLSSRVSYGDGRSARIIGSPWQWSRFRRYMTVAHVGSMHRRSLYDRIGLYDESFRITGDYELLLRAGPTLRTAYMPDVTAVMGTGGISSGQSHRVFNETARAKGLHAGLSSFLVAFDRYRAILGLRLRNILLR